MGWLPVASAGEAESADRVRVVEVADAATLTLYVNGPQAVYSAEADRTYIAYLGLDRDLYVTYYDHHTGEVATPVLADAATIAANDDHAAPTICVDLDGHIHVVWGSHNSAAQHVKSDSPHDISAWTDAALTPETTYNFVRVDPATGNLYVFYRAGSGSGDEHGSSFPAHEFAGMIKSTDGGSSWSSAAAIIDTTGSPESKSDVYLEGVDVGPDGRFHLVWQVARGTVHDDTRIDMYHAVFDPSTDTLEAADGTDLGSTVTWAEHTTCLIESDSEVDAGDVFVDGDRVVAWWFSIADTLGKFAVWDGSSWTTKSLDVAHMGMIYPVTGGLRHVVNQDTGADSVADLALYGSSVESDYWHEIATLRDGTDGFIAKSRVLGPRSAAVALMQEWDSTNEPNSATASDLYPIYLVIDESAAEYAGLPADSDHDHDSAYQPVDRAWMPLTTVVSGTPELVWDDDDSLIPTEVPI